MSWQYIRSVSDNPVAVVAPMAAKSLHKKQLVQVHRMVKESAQCYINEGIASRERWKELGTFKEGKIC